MRNFLRLIQDLANLQRNISLDDLSVQCAELTVCSNTASPPESIEAGRTARGVGCPLPLNCNRNGWVRREDSEKRNSIQEIDR